MKEALTRREMFKELVSKDTLKQVAGAWYGFTRPLSEGLNTQSKPESFVEKMKRINAKNMKNDRKEG